MDEEKSVHYRKDRPSHQIDFAPFRTPDPKGSFEPPVKPNRPWFLVRWIKAAILLSLDALLWFQKKRVPLPDSPKRILVCNLASFGDLVISTNVLPLLKRRYPASKIAFLTSSKTSAVLREHPLVTSIHTIDHWFGKKEQRFWAAFLRFLIDFRRVVKEIRRENYEMAIDLYPHFFLSAIPILWRSKIPIRIGRYTRGLSNLLTHIAPAAPPSEYIGQTHLNLLKTLGIDVSQTSPLPFYFSKHSFLLNDYIAVHMGTGYSLKEWDTQKWIRLVNELIDRGETVVLTGEGEREKLRCDQVAAHTGCLNYCNQLSWDEFASAIQGAKLLISVDSVSVHLASAVQIPCVVLFAGISSIPIWKPPYPRCEAVMKSLPCAPCLIRQGCSRMSCIQEIQVSEVLEAAHRLTSDLMIL